MGPNLLALIKHYHYRGIPMDIVRSIAKQRQTDRQTDREQVSAGRVRSQGVGAVRSGTVLGGARSSVLVAVRFWVWRWSVLGLKVQGTEWDWVGSGYRLRNGIGTEVVWGCGRCCWRWTSCTRSAASSTPVSYTHLRAHETEADL
eukprot:1057825-Rhodomonas_salina.1